MAAIREAMSNVELTETVARKLAKLVKDHPDNPTVRQYLGEFYSRCQRYSEAVQAFQAGLKLDPKNPLLHWDIGLAYHRMKKHTQAADYLEKALELGLDESLRRHAARLLKTLQGAAR